MSSFSNAQGPQGTTKGKDQVSRFHTRQSLFMLTVLLVLISAFFIMLARQYNLVQKHEKASLIRHFRERTAHLDNLLARVTSHVDEMRMVAEADLMQTHGIKALNQPLEFEDLKDAVDADRYNLNTFRPPITREMIGNLTGQGSMQNRSKDFYREIHMALVLNPLFRSVAQSIKNSAWIYYTSKRDFINIYPWVPSKDFKFSKELYTHEFYTLGLPQNNPGRQRFWTKVYVDEYGKGLMTTCAIPVYDSDRFMGTVAIDLTVDFLNTVVSKFRPKQGTMFLVNDRDQLLAHPTLITSKDERTRTLNETLPKGLRNSIDRFTQIPDKQISTINSFNILRSYLRQAPWQVIYVAPAHSIWSSFIELIGIGPGIILAVLLILVVTMFAVTHLQFILPSRNFVNYIMARSQRKLIQMDQKIPRVWKPWFSAVEKIFDENEKLTQELQEQNENLEQRVKQRTAELEKEIEERKQIQETLRKSEERFRDISFSMADWIWEIDSQGRYTFASETVEQILGYKPDELLRKTPFDFMPEDEAKHVEMIFKKIVAEKRPIVDRENWNLTKEGKRVCLLTNGVPIFDEQGELTGYRGVDRDISDRKRAEKEQEILAAQLQRAEKMEAMGLMAGGIAHDLNNILSGIVSYPELLLMDLPEDSPLRNPIKTIQESGMRAVDVVSDLITIARGVATAKEALNFNTIIAEYLGSAEHQKLERTHSFIDFKAELNPDLLNSNGSSTHIKKILMNLVMNASEAIEGAGIVTISTENRYLDEPLKGYEDVRIGEYVLLSVSDNGSGISPQDLDRIFEPFYTKKVMGRSGTGLGLAVVWNSMQDHNGYINVNTSEKGTVFELYFPTTREQVADEGEQVPLEDYLGHGEKILVVDDEERQREIANEILTRLGYTAEVVSSGEEAIEYVKEHPVDLILLDMVMPKGINGRKTYEEIIKIRPGQKAIIASGFAKTKEVDLAQESGAGKYIKKPYTLAKLGVAVKEELER